MWYPRVCPRSSRLYAIKGAKCGQSKLGTIIWKLKIDLTTSELTWKSKGVVAEEKLTLLLMCTSGLYLAR